MHAQSLRDSILFDSAHLHMVNDAILLLDKLGSLTDSNYFFEAVAEENEEEKEEGKVEVLDDVQNIMACGGLNEEGITLAGNNFDNVDENNVPVEENLATMTSGTGSCVYKSEWGNDGKFPRWISDAHNTRASINNFPVETTKPPHLQLFV